MAITTTWGYQNGTTQVTSNLKMPVLESSDYSEVLSNNLSDDNFVVKYKNLTTQPTNLNEYVQLRGERRKSISKSYKAAFPPSTKEGYMFSIKLEDTIRVTDEQGISTDNPASITLTCTAGDGTCVTGGLDSGVAWLNYIQRFFGLIFNGTYDISDNQITINTSTQAFLDRLMRTSGELTTNIITQA